MIRKIIDKLSNILSFLMSVTYHRDKKIILFGAWFGERFADNPRFLYQYLSENKEKLGLTHVIWVTHSKSIKNTLQSMGYEVYLIGTKESTKYHKKAGMHILCNGSVSGTKRGTDIDTKLSYGAKRVDLWHGVGVVKGVSQDSLEYKRKKKENPRLYALKEALWKNKLYRLLIRTRGGWEDSFFLSPTQATTEQFGRFKYIQPQKFIQAGYPRTCKCIKLLKEEDDLLQLMTKYKYVILYLPTFRKNNVEQDCINLSEVVRQTIKEQDALWIQKAHIASDSVYHESDLESNIVNLKPQFDVSVIMPYIDILVTDYSSAASDARFFRKRILFYLPDFESYKNGENGFTPESNELLYGPQYFSASEFCSGLSYALKENPEYLDDEYERIRYKYWGENMDISEIWERICLYTNYKNKKNN